jgi:flagellar M-ring protein FliF
VAHVLPFIPDDESKVKRINVVPFEKIDTPEPEGPPLTATAATWLGHNWSTLGMMGMGVFSLIMLRGMVRSIPPPSTLPSTSSPPAVPTGAPPLGVVRPPEDDEEEEASPERVLHRTIGGPNLREELAEMVREDPDAAAKVIGSWIGNAG